MLITLKNLGVT